MPSPRPGGDNRLFTTPRRPRRILLPPDVALRFPAPTVTLATFSLKTRKTMDSSTPTEEFDPARLPTSAEQAPTEIHRPPIPAIPSSREQCAACGAALAPDQRYCVECGQRCGGGRPPFTEGARRAGAMPAGPLLPRRPLMSINTTLIAGVGTLLLAMGIGILIGRSGQGSGSKSAAPAVQLVTVPGAGTASAAGGTSSSAEPALPGASTSTTSTSASKSSGAKSTSKSTSKKTPPPPKTVTVGSKGKGPGYQKGKFTGNFFGEGEE